MRWLVEIVEMKYELVIHFIWRLLIFFNLKIHNHRKRTLTLRIDFNTLNPFN